MKFRRQKRYLMHIELTPLIDAVFILLIFFMLSSNFLKPAILLKLPVVGYNEQIKQKKSTFIAITKDQNILYNGEMVTIDGLKKRLSNMESSNRVVFSADKSVRYELFVKIMAELKAAGIEDVALENEFKK